MSRRSTVILCLLVCTALLSACSPAGPGPKSWIDFPLNNSHFDLAPLEIIFHASFTSGVEAFEITIDGEVLEEISATGSRFAMDNIVWDPEEPGVYTIGITAFAGGGIAGQTANSVVYIGDVELPPELMILKETECDFLDYFEFGANPGYVEPGGCTTLFWEVLGSADFQVVLDGEPVESLGERKVCPDDSTLYDLLVESGDGICSLQEMVVVDPELVEIASDADYFINFEGSPVVISRGECARLFWEVGPESETLPMLDGTPVDLSGELEVCPETTTTYYLAYLIPDHPQEAFVIIEVEDGATETDSQITGTVTATPAIPAGNATSTPTPKPPSGGSTPTPTESSPEKPGNTPTNTAQPQATKTPPDKPTSTSQPQATKTPTPTQVDNTPPNISGASISPSDFVYTSNGSCSPTTFKITVNVSDASGIKNVVLNWTGNGVRSGPVTMNKSGSKYKVNLGSFQNSGGLSKFSITATDQNNNSKTIRPSWIVQVEACGGS